MKLLVHQLVTTSLIAFQLRPVKGFTNPTSKKRIIQSPSSYRRLDHCLSNPSHFLTGVGHLNQANQSSGDDLNDLRDDIQEMRREALDRLNVLDEKLSSDEVQDGQRADTIKDQSKEFAESVAVSNDPSIVSLASRPFPDVSPKRDELSLLDGTCWKLSLNIGREQGKFCPHIFDLFIIDSNFESINYNNTLGDVMTDFTFKEPKPTKKKVTAKNTSKSKSSSTRSSSRKPH